MQYSTLDLGKKAVQMDSYLNSYFNQILVNFLNLNQNRLYVQFRQTVWYGSKNPFNRSSWRNSDCGFC